MSEPLHIVLHCADALLPRVRYVFDTLFMAGAVPVVYASSPPTRGLWLLYAPTKEASWPLDRCLAVAHCPQSWDSSRIAAEAKAASVVDGLATVLPATVSGFESTLDIPFDLVANAFYFLTAQFERSKQGGRGTRQLYSNSVFACLGVPQDVVDRYLERLMTDLAALGVRNGVEQWAPLSWPEGSRYALVLSHDVDFLPAGRLDMIKQGAKTFLRHLVRQRDPEDAARATIGLARALLGGRDPYGGVAEIIAREKQKGVRSSFQVAVAHRHPNDVNYRIEDDPTRDLLRAIPDAGFDLCLHGSYRSTERQDWYIEEVATLTRHLGRPLGSRQHFLSFDYDVLFGAQEAAGIEYDMSMGFPDRIGPRIGFSYPYLPYCLKEERPYNVVQISLLLMDVTLRSYMGLKGKRAWDAIAAALADLERKRGAASAVWHPIVFGGARDPGYDELYWGMIDRVRETGGVATDARTINDFWRSRATRYPSFAQALASPRVA